MSSSARPLFLMRLAHARPPAAEGPNGARAHEDPRTVEDMLAGCEYELKQVARDVARTHRTVKAPAVFTRRRSEPFVIEGGLRDPDVRRRLGLLV